MRAAAAMFLFFLVPGSARADGIDWGGSVAGLRVSAQVLGFHEGAGDGGWTVDGAERFASRGAELAAMVPGVSLTERVEGDRGLVAVVGSRSLSTGLRDFLGTDDQWDALVRFFAHLGYTRRRFTVPRLYTLALPVGVDSPSPVGQSYFEECAPCAASAPVHVVEGRRVVGVFFSRASARAARRELAGVGVHARVVRL